MDIDFVTEQAQFSSGRVFNGTYLDDFLSGLVAWPKNALILGSAQGALAFSLASACDEDIDVVGVDRCERSVDLASSLGRFLAHDRVQFIAADARAAVSSASLESFDVICVDLYDEEGFSTLNFDPSFWESVAGHLSPRGVLLVNAWGLPEYLGALGDDTPVADVGRAVRQGAGFLTFLPLQHMRNTTMVFTECDIAGQQRRPPWGHIERMTDRCAARALSIKLRATSPANVAATQRLGSSPTRWDFARIAAVHDDRLRRLVHKFPVLDNRRTRTLKAGRARHELTHFPSVSTLGKAPGRS